MKIPWRGSPLPFWRDPPVSQLDLPVTVESKPHETTSPSGTLLIQEPGRRPLRAAASDSQQQLGDRRTTTTNLHCFHNISLLFSLFVIAHSVTHLVIRLAHAHFCSLFVSCADLRFHDPFTAPSRPFTTLHGLPTSLHCLIQITARHRSIPSAVRIYNAGNPPPGSISENISCAYCPSSQSVLELCQCLRYDHWIAPAHG
jgi:hypothetical protein